MLKILQTIKEKSFLAKQPFELQKRVLEKLAELLKKETIKILEENKKDLALMDKNDPRYDRLLLNENRIISLSEDVKNVATLPAPFDRVLSEHTREDKLYFQKISVPLGVVGVIFESRPNVIIDVFALCFKSGNACILKGGKEARHSNTILIELIHSALASEKLPKELAFLFPSQREALPHLLHATTLVDAIIPRGSKALIEMVRAQAKVPVIETGAGIVHTYFDQSADKEIGQKIIENAKTRRVSVCNALDTLILHEKRLSDLFFLVAPLALHNVVIYADQKSYRALQGYPTHLLKKAEPCHYGQEYLSYQLAIKTVADAKKAFDHIAKHGSSHSEAIIAEDLLVIQEFIEKVDAAALYVNASTAFTDGKEFGLGAEIGISTQKLHVRGPIGLEALTSYKWIVLGKGHIRP